MSLVERRRSDLWFALLSLLFLAVELVCLVYTPLDLAADEAHYWDWSRRLDWSYYSKGPIVALLIAASTTIFGHSELAVRLPAIICFNLFSLLFYAFLRRNSLPQQALWGWLTARSMLIFAQMGLVMTTDAPAALLWLVAIVGAHRAITAGTKDGWLLFGVATGLGILAKYTLGILLPSVALFLLLTPSLRFHLRTFSFWTGIVVSALLTLPIFIWNLNHDWVNFAHNAGHLYKGTESFLPRLTLRYLGELLGGQLLLVGPVVFVGLILGYLRGFALWRKGDVEAGLFVWSGLPLVALCLMVSLTKRVYANWPLPVDVSGLLAAVYVLRQPFVIDKKVRRRVKIAIGCSAALTVIAHLPFLGVSFGVPPKMLTTKKLAGWSELGARVELELSVLRATEKEVPVVVADDYEVASAVAFYAESQPEAYCANLDSRRMNQYDIWGGWSSLKGRPVVIVVKTAERLQEISKQFARVEPNPVPFPMTINYLGEPLQSYWIARGYGYSGFTFPLPEAR